MSMSQEIYLDWFYTGVTTKETNLYKKDGSLSTRTNRRPESTLRCRNGRTTLLPSISVPVLVGIDGGKSRLLRGQN